MSLRNMYCLQLLRFFSDFSLEFFKFKRDFYNEGLFGLIQYHNIRQMRVKILSQYVS